MTAGISRRQSLLMAAGLMLREVRAAEKVDVTPADQFFVRDHFEEPDLSLSTWKMRIEGRVPQPLELTFSDLLESPTVEQASLLECAGNGESGAAFSMGVWQGIRLSSLLERAGADPAADVLIEGADGGTAYTRVMPAKKCRAPESLIAFRLNGRFLPRRNGFPARVILPGWYGMDSVKWLQRIVVLGRGQRPADGDMPYLRLRKSQPPVRITSVLVKSIIDYPANGAKLLSPVLPVSGYAWTGEGVIRRVSVSLNGGHDWTTAKLESPPKPFSWVRWSYAWHASPGEYVLMSRAEDSRDNRQPLTRDPERLDAYELNWCAPVHCTVR